MPRSPTTAPRTLLRKKIKRKGDAQSGLSIDLVENPDIIARRPPAGPATRPLIVGFAAETNDTVAHARQKLQRKGLDAIVLNDVSDPDIGFMSDENAVTFITPEQQLQYPRQDKRTLATEIMRAIYELYTQKFQRTNYGKV